MNLHRYEPRTHFLIVVGDDVMVIDDNKNVGKERKNGRFIQDSYVKCQGGGIVLIYSFIH
jgi:hypothetical protein